MTTVIQKVIPPHLTARDRHDYLLNAMTYAHTYCVYMMCNKWHNVIYTGVTNDLLRRVSQHRNGTGSWFAKRYNVDRLVYFESTDDVYAAIVREKQIKAGSRAKKIALIESQNPDWKDLFDDLLNSSD